MSTNMGFFESPQAAAVYKHKLLKSYIPVWAGKVGSTSAGGQVYVYDAYSGPGRYRDEAPGSPELLVDTAIEMAKTRSVHTIFSEKEKPYCDELRALLAAKEVDPSTYEVRPGPVEDHVKDVLRQVGDLPLFVFLDPFGLTIPLDQVVQILTARQKRGLSSLLQPKTELLMNFSYEAVRRISGALRTDKEYAAKDAQVSALDRALGGNWWHKMAMAQDNGWVTEVLLGYAGRIQEAVGGGCITADVSDSLGSEPVYELILFTRHRDGLWAMANAMSYARKEWRGWLQERREQASQGQMEIGSLEFADDESAWVDELAANMAHLLSQYPEFVIEDELSELFGRTLGLAREMHIRAAWRALEKSEVANAVPTGSLQKARLRRRAA